MGGGQKRLFATFALPVHGLVRAEISLEGAGGHRLGMAGVHPGLEGRAWIEEPRLPLVQSLVGAVDYRGPGTAVAAPSAVRRELLFVLQNVRRGPSAEDHDQNGEHREEDPSYDGREDDDQGEAL